MMTETEHIKDIRRCFEALRYSGRSWTLFEDWVELMLHALMRSEDEYLAVMGRYDNSGAKGSRPADLFSRAFGHALAHMRETNEEILGPLYEEYASDHYRGQYFTPSNVAGMMAEMTIDDDLERRVREAAEREDEGKLFRILDPACGAGCMLIESVKRMSCAAVDASEFWGCDIDRTCCRMTVLNMIFFNVPGVVVHMNSLSMESWAAWRTTRSYVWGGSAQTLDHQWAARQLEGALLAGAVPADDEAGAKAVALPGAAVRATAARTPRPAHVPGPVVVKGVKGGMQQGSLFDL